MNKQMNHIITKAQEHTQLQSMRIPNDSLGQKKLLSYLNAPGKTDYLCTTLLPYVKKCCAYQKRQKYALRIFKIIVCIFIVLIVIAILMI